MEPIDRAAIMGALTSSEGQAAIKAMTGAEAYNYFLSLLCSAPTIDPIRAEGGWISVKERLPEELTPVLIYTEETGQGVCMAFLENGKWLDGYSGRGIVMMQQELVTHWMPMPEPPKKDDHD